MNEDDRDDVDNEHTVLSPPQLDRIQNYCNHLVVFVDNNLISTEIIASFSHLSSLTSTIDIITFFIERISR